MKIAVLSSHTPSLFWFRLEMMKEFVDRGHSVIALGADPEAKWKDKFSSHDIDYRQLSVERNGVNPIKDLQTLAELYRFMKLERPDRIFTYQAKTVIYGSLAAHLNGIREIYSLIAGLGSIFIGTGIKNRLIREIMQLQYKVACNCSKVVFFQNHDDKGEFLRRGLVKENKTEIINGSGVNIDKFKPVSLPENPAFLFIGRLIKDKGIMEYLQASRIIKSKYPEVRCMIVGPFDSNPSALKPEELQPYIEDGIVEYFGEQSDVRPFIAQCSTYVLPSYHEGTPKTVLEAMAMGRPIITTDAPGCKETIKDGLNGYLVEVKNIHGLVDRMIHTIIHPDIWKEMGAASSEIAKEKYDVGMVNKAIMQVMGV